MAGFLVMVTADQPAARFASPPDLGSAGGGDLRALSVTELQARLPNYEVLELLGRGGMGAVYKALQKSLRRLVAIKVLARESVQDDLKFAERFQHEAMAMARLSHPGIVNVHDAGEAADGLLYFVMEHVEGRDLAHEIAERGRLPEAEVRKMATQIVEALGYAHANGIVHRDIKPANILLDAQGWVKVADFGLAKASEPLVSTLLTKSGTSMGTADFMAPETRKSGMADARSDLFSLGVTLYQMLTGELPQGMFKLPSELHPELDARWDEIICKALEPRPQDRYQSTEELKRDLATIDTDRPRAAKISSTPKRRWRLAAAWVGVALVAGLSWPFLRPQTTVEQRGNFDLEAFRQQMAAADVETQWALLKAKLDELNGSDVTILRRDEDKQRGRITYLGISNNGKELKDITPVAALTGVVALFFHDVWLRDISCLKGMKLEQLGIFQSQLTDLSPLETMPVLWSLNLPNAKGIQDFSGLKKLPLGLLTLNTTPHLKDIAFVREMPQLRVLNIRDTGVKDLSPLAGTGIEELDCNADIPITAELLRSLPKLKKLNGRPVEEWWQKTGAAPAASPAGKVIDLMPLIDLKRDVVAGIWTREGNDIQTAGDGKVPGGGSPRLQLPFQPPEEYDFEIEFTPQTDSREIVQILSGYGRQFLWVVNMPNNAGMKAGFDTISGLRMNDRKDGTLMRDRILKAGSRHRSKVEVRKTGLRGYVDDELLVEWGTSPASYQHLDLVPHMSLRESLRLGIGVSPSVPLHIHRITVRKVTGE